MLLEKVIHRLELKNLFKQFATMILVMKEQENTELRCHMNIKYSINSSPVYYDKNADLVVHKVYPFEHFHDIKLAKYLWTGTFVKIVLDKKTENDYHFLWERYESVRKEYHITSTPSLLERSKK